MKMLEEFSGNQRFSIVRRLGAGGMGTVYEAQDQERQTRVALKTLRNVDPVSIYRFKVEFRSLTELSHENLLPLYELFFEDGHWFFTMELLEGATDLLTFIRGERTRMRSSGSDGQASGHAAEAARSKSKVPIEDSRLTSQLTSNLTSVQTLALTSEATSIAPLDQLEQWTAERSDPEATAVLTIESDPGLQELRMAAKSLSPIDSLAVEPRLVESAPAPPPANPSPIGQPLDYELLRRTFLTIAQGVRALHASGKLHRDLKPENVMVRADGRPVLLDFGLILDLKPQVPTSIEEQRRQPTYKASTDKQISGTFAYMAPEQATGSPLLNSSDWYAFGVMLFEALTGRLPFTGKSIEIIRARLTQDAPPPSRFAPSTPPDLERLCIDLLNRDPEKRPASAEILRCLSGESTAIEESFQNHRIFIGRESYLTSLNTSFDALEQGHAGVRCVHGRSGVGKTTLLQHFIAENVTARGGILLEGRCYEQESVPYKAVDNMVDALTQLLMEMPAERLREVLPKDIQALARVFPVLRRVNAIGDAEATPGIANDPLLVRQQAFQALGQLLTAIGANHPLVLYIDDLQWGDIDSALLLSSVLAQQPSPRMLLLLSYRSEYAGNPCLREFRRAWESGYLPYQEIEVLPLTPEESRELASELLEGTAAAASQIERIVEQARGSAFFVQELAENLRSGMEWQAADTDGASAQLGDLDEVLWRRVQHLPEEARLLIEIVAVAGQPIQIGDLLHTRSLAAFPQHAVKLLRTARLVRSTGTRLSDEIETFHDRVRESITKFLSAPVNRDYHQQIADALEQNEEAAPETIASHLESAQSPRASHFYELAGEHAIQVLAFDRAEEYLKHAAKLAPTSADRVRVEVRLVHFYTDTARFQDAYDVGCEGVARFGFKLPRKFSPPVLLFNMLRGLVRKGRRKPSEFLDLPTMTDERLIAVVSLISAMAKAAYQVRPEICVTICTIAVNLCLKHGNTPDAAIDYMVFGCIFLGGILGRAETGYEFGRLALALIDKYQNDKQRAEVNFVVGYFGTSWMRPAVEAERLWEVAYTEGRRTGDLFHTGTAVAATIQSLVMRGAPLDEIDQRIEEFWPVLEQAHLREPMTCLTSTRQLLAILRRPENANMQEAEDPQLLADLAGFGSRHFAQFHFLNQCMLHALAGDVNAGLNAAARSATYLPDSKGLLNTPEHHFWFAILCAMDPNGSRAAVKTAEAAKKKFVHWARRCPTNFALRHELLAAEEARLLKQPEEAMEHYMRAIELGEQHRTLHLLGFANHRAQLLASSLGRSETAQQFANAAHRAYLQWGAHALVPIPRSL